MVGLACTVNKTHAACQIRQTVVAAGLAAHSCGSSLKHITMPAGIKPLAHGCTAKLPPVSPHAAARNAAVRATLDTGFNEIKQRAKQEEYGALNTRFRKGESFSRMRALRLVQLLELGDLDMLLLDLRDVDDYERWHIRGARCYPVRLLRRAMHPFTADILAYRNQPGKVVVIYDRDGAVAAAEGNLFVEKGLENVTVLSGGILALQEVCPQLVEGTQIPPPPQPQRPPRHLPLSPRRSSRCSASPASSRPLTACSSASSFRSAGGPQRWL